jgi:transposase
LKAIARDAGIGYRTAQRWVMRYRKYGLAGLARNDRADRGCRRRADLERIVWFQNEGKIMKIYTLSTAAELESDLRQLRQEENIQLNAPTSLL